MTKCFHIKRYRGYLFSWEDLKGCQSHTNVNTRSMLITKAWITCKFHLTQLNWKTGPSALPLCCGLQMSLLLTFIINKYLQLELQWWQNGSSNLTGTPWVTIFIKLTIPPNDLSNVQLYNLRHKYSTTNGGRHHVRSSLAPTKTLLSEISFITTINISCEGQSQEA